MSDSEKVTLRCQHRCPAKRCTFSVYMFYCRNHLIGPRVQQDSRKPMPARSSTPSLTYLQHSRLYSGRDALASVLAETLAHQEPRGTQLSRYRAFRYDVQCVNGSTCPRAIPIDRKVILKQKIVRCVVSRRPLQSQRAGSREGRVRSSSGFF